jgi:hypothetical protein
MSQSVHIYALQRAVLLAGGADALARMLDVPGFFVDSWLRGVHPVPLEVFLRAVDLVLEDDMKSLRVQAAHAKPPCSAIVTCKNEALLERDSRRRAS